MDYKEKYENALERARNIRFGNPSSATANVVCEYIFPELKVSEDEKIKKAIHIYLDWLDGKNKDYQPKGEYTIRDMLAWLEKQGDYNILVEEIKERKELISKEKKKATNTNDKLSLGGRLEELLAFTKEKQSEQNLIMAKSPQLGEQKPSDKIEPKFKVGDWVVYEAEAWREVLQIETIESERYTFTNGSSSSFDEEQYMRLWTIRDAKDGDVLVNYNDIFLFDGTVEKKLFPFAYCGIIDGEFGIYDRKIPFTHSEYSYPATKEQRDLLFQKMKEAKYEWDVEKKALRKIDDYFEENCKGFQETGKCFTDGECKAKRDAEQNPAWSEDDELMMTSTVNTLKLTNDAAQMKIDWLKSIKDRMKGE